MKIFIQPSVDSRGINRVVKALFDFALPDIKIVPTLTECDLQVIHVYGRHTTTQKQIDWCKAHQKHYAMIQYCLRSTMRPNTHDWMKMWHESKVVWSYYDLKKLALEDTIWPLSIFKESLNILSNFNFYYAPLGVDPEIFKETGDPKEYVAVTNSQSYLSEGTREVRLAVSEVGGKMLFLGHEINRPDAICKNGISDEELAQEYSKADFVTGLRRKEGFELPVIEGAMCGARPIVFNAPHYRKWFKDFAIFIPEKDRPTTVNNLVKVFKAGVKPVTPEEKEIIRKRFDWKTIIEGFWQQVLQ